MQLILSLGREPRGQGLPSYQPHGPARNQRSAQEHYEAIQAVADHVAGGFAVGDAEDDRGKEREYESGAEVGELDGHDWTSIRPGQKAGSSPAFCAGSE